MSSDYFSHLTEEEKNILKHKGTESPFSGEYNDFYKSGIFVCRACNSPLYQSKSKFDSGCGWPSFDDEIPGAIERFRDTSLGRVRTEICCVNCGGHLGHVFVGEKFTDKNVRHCVNSLSIRFVDHQKLQQIILGGENLWFFQKKLKELEGVYLCKVNKVKKTIFDNIEFINKTNINFLKFYFNSKKTTLETILNIFLKIYASTNFLKKNTNRLLILCNDKKQKLTIEKMILQKNKILKNPIFFNILLYEDNI